MCAYRAVGVSRRPASPPLARTWPLTHPTAVPGGRRHRAPPHRVLQAGPGGPPGTRKERCPIRPSATTWACCGRSSSGSSTGTGTTPPRRVPDLRRRHPQSRRAAAPKFLDDPTAAKFMADLAADPDRRRRLMVELLARTGMRAGELGRHRRRRHVQSRRHLVAADPGRQAAQRPQRPAPPAAGRADQRLPGVAGTVRHGFLLERDDSQPFDRRTIHRYVQRVARRPASATSTPTSSATRWPPSASTEA